MVIRSIRLVQSYEGVESSAELLDKDMIIVMLAVLCRAMNENGTLAFAFGLSSKSRANSPSLGQRKKDIMLTLASWHLRHRGLADVGAPHLMTLP